MALELAASRGGQSRRARLRGLGRRRHSDCEDSSRRPGRQYDRPRLRHPERHLQLHSLAHGTGGFFRGMPQRAQSWAMPKPTRPSTSAASTPRTSSPSWRSLAFGVLLDAGRDHTSRASSRSPSPISAPPTPRLSRQAARRGAQRTAWHRTAGASDHGPRVLPDGAGHGRDQCGHRSTPTPSSELTLVGPGAGGDGHGFGCCRRHRRHRAAASARRPSACPSRIWPGGKIAVAAA